MDTSGQANGKRAPRKRDTWSLHERTIPILGDEHFEEPRWSS